MDAPSKFSRDYYICAEALIPPADYKENWIDVRINFTLKRSGKICVSTVYKNKIEAGSEDVKIRAYMLLHMLVAIYERIGTWPDEESEVRFIKSDAGRPLLDVTNSHSQVQFSLMKWVTPDWLEQPKVAAMALYLAKLQEKDPTTYNLFMETRKYMIPEFAKICWDTNIF